MIVNKLKLIINYDEKIILIGKTYERLSILSICIGMNKISVRKSESDLDNRSLRYCVVGSGPRKRVV